MNTGQAIAQLLIKENLVDEKQVAYAQRIQGKLSDGKSLLNTLQELDYFSQEQLNTVLSENHLDIKIGDLLVELGDITPAELTSAMFVQENHKSNKKLGEILIEQHCIKEQRLTDIIANQLGFPHIEPRISRIADDLLDSVKPQWCEEYGFIPVRRGQDCIYVACVDPAEEVRLMAERALQQEVKLAVCTRSGFDEALKNMLARKEFQRKSQHKSKESRVVSLVDEIIEAAIVDEASDIHIEPMDDYIRVRFRRDGVLWEYKRLSLDLLQTLCARLKVMSSANIAEKRHHQDGKIEFAHPSTGDVIDIRCSFYVCINGEKVCLRLLNRKTELLNIEEIGMAAAVVERFKLEALDVPTGVVIMTGPTGSGKTTTLYACIDYLNNDETSIITAEEPVEYVVSGITQCSINPKIDLTFQETLRHMVRQDPDIIVLGEIRDSESAESAIQSALTGHKVLSTFHTEDTIGGLLRLMNMNIETFLISSTVVSVLAQRLLRKNCSHCSQPEKPTAKEMQRLGITQDDMRIADYKKGVGCEECHYSGFKGRVGIYELLVLNERVKDAIINHKSSYDIRRISVETSGLISLMEDGIEKASSGLTTLSEILRMLPLMDKPRPLREIRRLSRGTND